jgi:hypothetical protein
MNDITKFIYDKAKGKFDNERDAEQFVNGFITKVASIIDGAFESKDPKSSYPTPFEKGIGESLGRTAVGGVATLGVMGITALANTIKDHTLYNKFLQALDHVSKSNRLVKATDKQKVLSYAHTIFKFAPHVATDENLLSNILSHVIQGESIDANIIKLITELENRYRDSTGFDPKKWL